MNRCAPLGVSSRRPVRPVPNNSKRTPKTARGYLPDRYNDYDAFNKYFVVPRLALRGVLPSKTFLDVCFDEQVAPRIDGRGIWRVGDIAKHRFQSIDKPGLTDRPSVAAVVSLCLTERYYDIHELRRLGVRYTRFEVQGNGDLPRLSSIFAFLELFAHLSYQFPNQLVILHCTHGINRTGFFSLMLLLAFQGRRVEDAVDYFGQARGRAIDRDELIEYAKQISATAFQTPEFIAFMKDLQTIYQPNSKATAHRYLHSVLPFFDTSDVYSAILASHSSGSPLGLLDIQRFDSGSTMKLSFATEQHAQRFDSQRLNFTSCLRRSVVPETVGDCDSMQQMLQQISVSQCAN